MSKLATVAIQCKAPMYTKLKTLWSGISPTYIYQNHDIYVVMWEQVEWDEKVEAVKKIMHLFDELDFEASHYAKVREGFDYRFLKMGSGPDDIEKKDYGKVEDFKLEIVTSVIIPEDLPEIYSQKTGPKFVVDYMYEGMDQELKFHAFNYEDAKKRAEILLRSMSGSKMGIVRECK